MSAAASANKGGDDYYYGANKECVFRTSSIVINCYYYNFTDTNILIGFFIDIDDDGTRLATLYLNIMICKKIYFNTLKFRWQLVIEILSHRKKNKKKPYCQLYNIKHHRHRKLMYYAIVRWKKFSKDGWIYTKIFLKSSRKAISMSYRLNVALYYNIIIPICTINTKQL